MANGTPRGGSASVWSERLGQALELGYGSVAPTVAQAAACGEGLRFSLHASNSDSPPANFLLFSLMPRLPTGSGWAQSGSMPMVSETLQCPRAAARRVGLPGMGA